MVVDINKLADVSFALVETLVLLKQFDRPYLLLLNKLDLFSAEEGDLPNIVEELLQTERLKKEYPQVCILGVSLQNKSHILHIKDWVKQILKLFGISYSLYK